MSPVATIVVALILAALVLWCTHEMARADRAEARCDALLLAKERGQL